MRTLFLLICTLCLFGCSGMPHAITPTAAPSQDTGSNLVYIVNHGWHTGIIVPAEKMNIYLPPLTERFKIGQWYEFGWGDKGFYQAQEITTGLTFRAMFWSSGAVMHVVSVPTSPEAFFTGSELFSLTLTDNGLSNMLTFIANSFERDEQNKIIPLRKGIYGDSQFYAATGRYYILNTCNKWTAKGLKSGGLNISPTLKLTSGSVMNYLKNNMINHQQDRADFAK